jgi:acrylyl-CoA reductase (NADPH)/3-hydroxypropionyl-CoA dehydratase/3-hydroxypropionyl-CoA synthetase
MSDRPGPAAGPPAAFPAAFPGAGATPTRAPAEPPPAAPPAIAAPPAQRNPVRDRAAWHRQREAAQADPGGFHGDLAKRTLHWWVPRGVVASGAASGATAALPEAGAWLSFDEASGRWRGWCAATAAAVEADLGAAFEPWQQAFDASGAPHWRWFTGGATNAAFNEVDRHVLAGHGAEAAFVFEGDRWDMAAEGGRGAPLECFPIPRATLLVESAKCALALKALGLAAGDRIALNLPNIPEQLYWTEGAKRLGVVYTPVFGGFSEKTLSDRIHDAGARFVITADGGWRNAQLVPYKAAYTDPALDQYVPVGVARAVVAARLPALPLPAATAARLLAVLDETLAGEVTVTRGDVMRGVGRALAEAGRAGLPSEAAAEVRIALAECLVATPPRVEGVIVVRHTAQPDLVWRPERDRWAHELTEAALAPLLAAAGVGSEAELLALPAEALVRAIWSVVPPAKLDAEFPLFFIYTSGSTGKPKGVVHVHGGWTAGVAHTMAVSFDARPGEVMYVVADPGWITGQAYMLSAALTTRVTSVVTEGAPVFPHAGRFASILERHRVSIFKAGVTFLKTVMQDPANAAEIAKHDLGRLRVATFCAEPVSPAVQAYGMQHVVPWYVNSYWATEHGGIAFTHFYGNADFPLRADAHTWALPWIFGDVWVEDTAGAGAGAPFPREAAAGGAPWRRAEEGEKGEIVVAAPYPYLARTVWGDAAGFTVEAGDRGVLRAAPSWRGDAARWEATYWRRWRGAWAYTQGDFAVRHADGSFSLHGRSDDVINVSGHRIGTEEIEGAILRDKALVADSPVGNVIVIGAPHREKGLVPLAFVTPATPGQGLSLDDRRRLSDLVRQEKGALAVPQDFVEVRQFPETRSGKYMRRMVRAIVEGEPLGDATTLKNPESLDELRAAVRAWAAGQAIAEAQRLFDRHRYFTIQFNEVPLPAGARVRRVATVFVTNPPVNALNERAIDELAVIVRALAVREDVIGVVFTGAGGAFVAGADLKQMLDEVRSEEEARVLPRNAQLAFAAIESMDKPCIAAVNGVALGGGFEFALACHHRIAEPTARFGLPEIRLRLLPGYGGTQRLPRLLAARRDGDGLRDAVTMILSGRTLGAEEAQRLGIVEELASGATDALSAAHARLREYAADGERSMLGRALTVRHIQVQRWAGAGGEWLEAILAEAPIRALLAQLEWAGRRRAAERALDALATGWNGGVAAGYAREAEHFAAAVVDPEGGRTGIAQFLAKTSPPLPVREGGVRRLADEPPSSIEALFAEGDLLPLGAPFYPGVTKRPAWQIAFGVARDTTTGAPCFGPPARSEVELLVPVPDPGPNEALVYLLTSEVNFNDIWALTGIPVSAFDGHDEDVQVTGSGGLALVVALGSEVRAEGRLAVGALVSIYSGQSELLSPHAGRDPMSAGFAIQGYETETGSHAQFLCVQAPQLHAVPPDLPLEAAGAYTLNLGTVYRALFTALKVRPGASIFVEGSATGTGLDALRTAVRAGLAATGLVSSADRAAAVKAEGAACAIDRRDPAFAPAFVPVPEGGAAVRAWEAAGESLLAAFRAGNAGRLADYAVSHAGETAFPRSFQLLAEGGRIAFYGASSGYHFTFVGKPGHAGAQAMLQRAGAKPGDAVLAYYGVGAAEGAAPLLDAEGLRILEALRALGARTVVATRTDAQRDFVASLGFEDALAGVVSIESLARRLGASMFHWPAAMPALPDAKHDTERFKAAVRDFQERTTKPFGQAVGALLRTSANPRGVPDLVFERAGHDALAVSTSLVRPFGGTVVFCEDLAHRRFSFYAPQVWTRQRRIVMPTAEIVGTHLCNAAEAAAMHERVAGGFLVPTTPTVVPWQGLPAAHQAMLENRHGGATYVCNHALPASGIVGRDALLERWAAGERAFTDPSSLPIEEPRR